MVLPIKPVRHPKMRTQSMGGEVLDVDPTQKSIVKMLCMAIQAAIF